MKARARTEHVVDLPAMREKASLSQAALARLMGVRVSTANRWERTHRDDFVPPPKGAVAIALLWSKLTDDERESVQRDLERIFP